MSVLTPFGPRILVKDETPIDDISARAKAAGIHVAVFEENKPKPTTGIIVAIGTDPELHAHLKIGDRVFFSRHSGSHVRVKGEEFRCLEFHEIITVEHLEETNDRVN